MPIEEITPGDRANEEIIGVENCAPRSTIRMV